MLKRRQRRAIGGASEPRNYLYNRTSIITAVEAVKLSIEMAPTIHCSFRALRLLLVLQ
jgi:hypothetical protein